MPEIYKDVEQSLTAFGMAMFNKQVQASGNYTIQEFNLMTHEHDNNVDGSTNTWSLDVSSVTVDPDLADHPRFLTAKEFVKTLQVDHLQTIKVFRVSVICTITTRKCSPHFIVLYDKLEDRECYKRHSCTCLSGVRCGVPCRHFWAVLRMSSMATFHLGIINDLWFKSAQSLKTTVKLHTFDSKEAVTSLIYCRNPEANQGLTDVLDPEPNPPDEELVTLISTKRMWGILQGLSKKAIEACISTGREDALCAVLNSFATQCSLSTIAAQSTTGTLSISAGASAPCIRVVNPAVVRGKGRPRGTLRVGVARQHTPSKFLHPLNDVTNDKGTSGEEVVMTQAYLPGNGEDTNYATMGSARSTAKRRKCGGCGGFNHDMRNCPSKHLDAPSASSPLAQASRTAIVDH